MKTNQKNGHMYLSHWSQMLNANQVANNHAVGDLLSRGWWGGPPTPLVRIVKSCEF